MTIVYSEPRLAEAYRLLKKYDSDMPLGIQLRIDRLRKDANKIIQEKLRCYYGTKTNID